ATTVSGNSADVVIPAPPTHANDGVHTIAYYATDNAGNPEASHPATVKIDTGKPSSSDDADPNWHNSDVTVHLAASDPPAGPAASSSGVKEITYSVDGGAATTVSGNSADVVIPAPPTHANDGVHTIAYYATDNAGNPEASHDATVRIDTRIPSSTITFPANGGSYNAATWNSGCAPATGDVCGTAADNTGGSGLQKVEVSLRQGTGNYWNGTSFSSTTEFFVSATGTASWQRAFSAFDFPADGTYTLHGRATDNAGNIEAVGPTATFTMNAPPKVNPGGPYTGNEGASVPLSGTASPDATSYSWSYTVVAADAGASCLITNPTSLTTASIKCTDDGLYTVRLTASDGVNSTFQDSTLTLLNVAPTVTITTPAQGTTFGVNVTVSLSANLSDPGTNDKYLAGACVISWGDNTSSIGTVTAASGTGKCTGTHKYTVAGDYNITARATDDNGGTGTSAPRLVRIR
ncbi:MAG: Ig-like domain-containing protein, partial [Gaiellaceae bacterium]